MNSSPMKSCLNLVVLVCNAESAVQTNIPFDHLQKFFFSKLFVSMLKFQCLLSSPFT